MALGDGKGNFSAPVVVYTNSSSNVGWDLVVGDFDGDHNADLAFSTTPCYRGGCDSSTVYALYGNGNGQFTTNTFSPSCQVTMTSADVNQDGRSDLAVTEFCPNGNTSNFVGALFGNSNRTFTEALSAANSADSSLLAVADLNGDLKNDLIDSYGILYTMGAYIALGTSTSSWNKQFEVPLSDTGSQNEFIIAADFNRDRKPDIVVYQAQNGMLQLLANTTKSGKFGACPYPTTGQGIHVCSPKPGGGSHSPVHFRTAANSFQPIRKTELWLDGNKITEQYRSWLDYSAPVATGSHRVDIYINNYDDDFQHTSFTFQVK